MNKVYKVLKIEEIDGYKVTLMFNHGGYRVIDFKSLFKKWGVKKGEFEYPLLRDLDLFQNMELRDHALTWPELKLEIPKGSGKFVIYDIDSKTLFDESEPDKTRSVGLGSFLRKMRKKQKLTLEEVARRIGTTKHYLSKIERDNNSVTWETYLKIFEAGLGKKVNVKLEEEGDLRINVD